MIVRELVALLGLKTDGKSFERGDKKIAGTIGTLKKLAAAVAGLAVVGWTRNLIRQTTILADSFDKLALKTGVAADTLQRLGFVGELAGANISDVKMAIKGVSTAAYEAGRGAKEYTDAWKRIGVSVKDTDGNLRSVEDLLPDIADGLAEVKSETEKVALVQKLLGRSGMNMLPMLRQTSDALREQMREAEQLGGVMDRSLIKTAVEVTDNYARINFAFQGIKNSIAKAMLPWIKKAQEGMIDWMKANGKWIRTRIGGVFRKLGQIIFHVGDAIGKATKRIKEWVKGLSTSQKGVLGVGAGVITLANLLKLPGGQIIVLLGLLALMIDDFMVWQKGGKSAIGDFIKWFNELIGTDLVAWLEKIADVFFRVFGSMWATLEAFGRFFVDLISGDLDQAWKDFIANLADAWAGLMPEIKQALSVAIGALKTMWSEFTTWFIKNVIDPISDAFKGIVKLARTPVSQLISGGKDDEKKESAAAVKGKAVGAAHQPFTAATGAKKTESNSTVAAIAKFARWAVTPPASKIEIKGGRIDRFQRSALDMLKMARTISTVVQRAPQVATPVQRNTTNVNFAPRTNIDVQVKGAPGMTKAEVRNEIVGGVDAVLDKRNREAMAAIAPSAR